jgi:nucleotide-binding universal stress UspA family protein
MRAASVWRHFPKRYAVNRLFSRVLVAVDEVEPSGPALALAVRLAHEHDGEIIFCHALDVARATAGSGAGRSGDDAATIVSALRERARALLAMVTDAAQRSGVHSVAHIEEGDPVHAVLAAAVACNAGAIVISTHARKDVDRFSLGSAAAALLRASRIPVLSVPPHSYALAAKARAVERIVVGIDGSAPSEAARRAACSLPQEDRRELFFCTVVGEGDGIQPRVGAERKARAHASLAKALAMARAEDAIAQGDVVTGNVEDTLLRVALEHNADLIAIGSHGGVGSDSPSLGSTAESIVRRAGVPVLVVRVAQGEPDSARSAVS